MKGKASAIHSFTSYSFTSNDPKLSVKTPFLGISALPVNFPERMLRSPKLPDHDSSRYSGRLFTTIINDSAAVLA